MRQPHGYGESCPVAHALDLIGDRWALLVIRELRLGRRRFADLQAALPRIGPTTLTQRLRDLTESGVLERAGGGRSATYRLTDWGQELEPVFGALARWGIRSPVVPLHGPISEDAVMLGARTFVLGATPTRPAPRQDAVIKIQLVRESYRVELAAGQLAALRRTTGEPGADADQPDAVLGTTAETIQAVMIGRVAMTAAAGQVSTDGDRRLARWLLSTLTPRGHRAGNENAAG